MIRVFLMFFLLVSIESAGQQPAGDDRIKTGIKALVFKTQSHAGLIEPFVEVEVSGHRTDDPASASDLQMTFIFRFPAIDKKIDNTSKVILSIPGIKKIVLSGYNSLNDHILFVFCPLNTIETKDLMTFRYSSIALDFSGQEIPDLSYEINNPDEIKDLLDEVIRGPKKRRR